MPLYVLEMIGAPGRTRTSTTCGRLILSQTHMTVAGRTSALVHSAVHRNEVLNVSASDIAETSAPWPFHPREQISP